MNREELLLRLDDFVAAPKEESVIKAKILADWIEEIGNEPVIAHDIRWIVHRCILENVAHDAWGGLRNAVVSIALGVTPLLNVRPAELMIAIERDPLPYASGLIIQSGYGIIHHGGSLRS